MAKTIEAAIFDSANQVRSWEGAGSLGDDNTQPARFDESSSSYRQTVEIQTISVHSMKSFTITSGPGRGCRVLVLVPAPVPLLFSLPIELRDLIYEFVLKSLEPIGLTTWYPKPTYYGSNPMDMPRIVQGSLKDPGSPYGPPDPDWDARIGKWKTRNRNALSPLLINRQIKTEAIKVLYGSNIFRFESSKDLRQILEKLKSSKNLQYVQHIQFGSICVASLPSMIKMLIVAPSLRTLQLSEAQNWKCTPGHLLSLCMPLLTSIQGGAKAGKTVRHIVDVVSSYQCTCCGCEALRSSGKSIADVYTTKNPVSAIKALRCKRTRAYFVHNQKF
jgi:hypothetical protein